MTGRILIAAIVLVGMQLTSKLITGRGMPTEIAQPQLDLKEMPLEIGAWRGKVMRLDPHVFQAIGAEMAIDRQYDSHAAVIDLHSDVFLHYGVRVLHPPELCYSSNGFNVDNGDTVEIAGKEKSPHAARLLTLSHNDSRFYCLYWYQVADRTFWNGDDQRRVVQSFRGKQYWPPMIKVMLQTSASSPEDAQKQLTTLAGPVYDWVCAFH